MCGIAGFFNPHSDLPSGASTILDRMGKALRHRGPDENARLARKRCGFAFERLAVIDIAGGMQPMISPDGRLAIVFNGEIFNYLSLRHELRGLGWAFRTHSDTEVILAGYHFWGVEVLGHLRGMFAIAIHDSCQNQLFLARDHTGQKPLYYSLQDDTIVFASEIKAILQYPGIRSEVNLEQLPRHFSFLWVPAPDTLFKNIMVLEPAHWAVYGEDGLKKQRYWKPDLIGIDENVGENDWLDQIETELQIVVEEQMLSDVPLGALLSGGVDSSTIVALMNRASADPVTTYTTGFDTSDLAEDVIMSDLKFSRLAAKYLRVNYHELILRADVIDILPKIVWHMDEPVADPAAITTYLICKAVKPTCTVMLTGIGGDEIFGGYPRYLATLIAERYRYVPKFLRLALLEWGLQALPAGRSRFARNAKKFIGSASLPFRDRYLGYLTYYSREKLTELLADPFDWKWVFQRHHSVMDENGQTNPLKAMMNLDLKTFLPQLNLLYTDKMSAAAAVEIRAPFLDHMLIERAARIPSSLKIKIRTQKYVLKKMANRLLPPEIAWRSKVGFGAPIGAWLRGKAREMMLDLLSERNIKRSGYFSYPTVKRIVDDHLSGKEYNANQIWQLMTFELWHRAFIESRAD